MKDKNISIKNPCIRNCDYNDDNLCVTCFRTKKEISYWGDFTEIEKKEILKKIKQRKQKTKIHNS